jgi:hypothetical protein
MDQRTLLEAIAEGFRKTPIEAIVSLFIMIGFILLFSLVSFFYRTMVQIRSRNEWQDEYDRLIHSLDLTINELDFLDELARFLVNPVRKILLLKNRNTYQHALTLWKKNGGKNADLELNLIKKIFGEKDSLLPDGFEKPFGTGRPARYITKEGVVYSGYLKSKNGNILVLEKIKKLKTPEKTGLGHLFLQDYRGFISHKVSDFKELDSNSILLHLSGPALSSTKKTTLSKIYVYPDIEGSLPHKSRMILMPNGLGMVENPDGMLKSGQAIKIAMLREINKIYRVNALVVKVSMNKRYAWLKFGYVKKKKNF